jgi:hypothetical protein
MKLKLLVPALLTAASFGTSGFAATISFSGPSLPVIGDPLSFKIFGAQLTQPTLGNSDWVLTIETNYGVTLPGSPNVIPDYTYNQIEYGIGDFLIAWNGNDYGIVLSPHDSYTAGSLYSVSGFQTSGQVMGIDSPRPSYPVLIAAGGTSLGSGSLSAAQTGNGTSAALYTITDDFSAPANFLGTGDFTIDMSSYVCANGFLTGTTSFVPEPGSFLLILPFLFALPLIRRFGRGGPKAH